MEEKINQLLQDEAFLDKMMGCESEKDIADVFTENGIEMSEEEVKDMLEQVSAGKSTGGELDESALEGVSGGRIIGARIIGKIIDAIKKGGQKKRYPGGIWSRILL